MSTLFPRTLFVEVSASVSISFCCFCLNGIPARAKSTLALVAANCLSCNFRRFGHLKLFPVIEKMLFECRQLIEPTGGLL